MTNVFSYFEEASYSINQGTTISLDLEGLTGYPAIKAPISDAILYVDKFGDDKGEKEAIAIEKILTDKDGKISIPFLEAGTYRILQRKL